MKHDEEWLDDNHMIKGDQRKDWVYSQAAKGYAMVYAEHMDRWVSVSERLPEIGVDVIVFSPTDANKPVIMRLTANGHFENDYEHAFGVTHWKPIGEPPE